MAAASRPWYDSREIAPGLWHTHEPRINSYFAANFYTLIGREADLQVDFGCGLVPLRPHLPASGKPVIAVATHAHVDHVGAFHEFETRLGHAAEADGFASMDDAATFQQMFRTNAAGASLLALPCPGFDLSAWALKPAPLTGKLAEGDRIDLGDRQFSVLHLPGHSPGSIALFDERDGLLFSGDAIYDDELVDDIPGACIPDYLTTMARLSRFDCSIAHGGHGPAFDGPRLRSIAADYIARRS